MEKTVKKLASLILVLFMCVSVFAGCSLVERDSERYLNATVATIEYESGQSEDISKRELLTAYNSYGYYYVQNGSTVEEAVKQTIEALVERKLTIKAVKDYYKNSNQEELNASEKTYLWDKTYSSMFDNLKSYFEEIVDVPANSEEDEQESANVSVFEQYQRSVSLEYKDIVDEKGNVVQENKLVIVKNSISESVRNNYQARKVANDYVDFELEKSGSQPFKELLYNKLMTVKDGDVESSRSWTGAVNNYISDIKENYEHENFASNKDAFMFEIERVYNIVKENYYVEKYASIYNGQQNSFISNVSVDEILKTYSSNVRADYTKYEIEEGDFSSDILSDVSSVDYVKNGETYFYLSYIKFEIDTARISELETLKANGTITASYYDDEIEKVYQNAFAQIRDSKTGETTGQTVSAINLANQISAKLDKEFWTVERLNNNSAESLAEKQNASDLNMSDEEYVNHLNEMISQEKANLFRDYFYLYNADDTYKGKDFNAVFGVDKTNSNAIVAGETFKEKTEVLSKLKTFYNGGDIKVGQISDLIRAEDAVYLFFYAGEVENVFTVTDENFDISRQEDAIKTLATTKLNCFSDKTIFDKLYDSATNDTYSVFETLNMNYLRSKAKKIEIIENEIKDLY